ncbi:uncharacterized protein BP5553_10147 [Venustampulla echinocandica]|uniref:Protein kinase domain-containing protein n=1 Tax=Venustampulla echinocandica TaxID=2656787 RepID=A0A370TAI1_9HELO|nr:uncharacterized protein BP5553_10147 [Venustampulla echinocandica]RDL30802.1 hypothetical protein BP5553_10147 [Venustampulla echinocandica]
MANVDAIVEKSIDEQTELFINSIDPATVCSIASSHNNGASCTLISNPLRGSFNICYPVIFGPDGNGQKWIVRIPLVPRVALVDEKLESEVAVMNFVQQKTTIPIPRIHGYAIKSQSQVGFAYVVIDYIEGDTLFDIGLSSLDESQKSYLYSQLADIFIQLRSHEFSCVGSLSIPKNNSEGYIIRRPLSIDLNQQELEGLQPGHISHLDDTYASAVDYVYSQMQLVLNWFSKGRNSVLSEFDAEIALYDLYQFQALAVEWINPTYNHGPFILMHGDLRPTNIIVNKDLTIMSIINWEWSRIIPAQLFVPPTWLTGLELSGIRSYFARKDYMVELVKLRDIVATRESQLPPTLNGHPLSKIWSELESNNSFLIAAGLLSLTSIANTYGDCLDYSYHGNNDRPGRAKSFVQARWQLLRLVKKKVVDRAAYLEDLERHGMAHLEHESPAVENLVSESKEEHLHLESQLLPSDGLVQEVGCSHLK